MKKIALIIDDDKINNFVCEFLINKYVPGVNIVSKTSSSEGLQFIREHSKEISFLFLDLNMPEYDGWDLLELMKTEGLVHFPIYIISSSVNTEDIHRSKKMPEIKNFFVKPLRSEDFEKINFSKS